jgi:hypothetical protein
MSQESVSIPFVMRHQLKSEWCWAAVTESVDQFFDEASPWTQCKIVTTARRDLHGLDCCTAALDPKCNQPYYLQAGLKTVRRLGGSPISKQLSVAEVKEQLNDHKPACLLIEWRNKGGHFIVISGYHETPTGAAWVHLEDPLYGDSQMPFDLLTSTADGEGYRGAGNWTATFLLTADSK